MERFNISKVYGFKNYLISVIFNFVLLLSLIIISVLFSPLSSNNYSFFPFLFSVIICALFFILLIVRLSIFLARYKTFIKKEGRVEYLDFLDCKLNNSIEAKEGKNTIDVYLLANKYTEYCFGFNKGQKIKCFVCSGQEQKAVLYY